MKILYIVSANGLDYLSDCIFHGLVSLNHEIIDLNYLWYLSQPLQKQKQIKLYGKGFTISGLLPNRSNIDRTNILEKIQSNFFDCIIYGSIHRCQDYLNQVLKYYSKDKIIFIDGQDETNIINELLNKGIYFKRQLNNNKAYPISFSIPEQKIIKEIPKKQKLQAFIIPGKKQTYIYNDQKSYYYDYAISYFGITCKKAGWDCMRHYQIIGNHCLPYFSNFQNCPKNTMVNWPKHLQLETNNMIEINTFSSYQTILQEFFNYCKNYLTTKNSAQYVLSKL